MNTILKPLIEVNPNMEFSVGAKLFKKIITGEYQEYKLVRANWDGAYMMLIRKIDKNSNKAEYGIIPEELEFDKLVINKSSFKRTLGDKLFNWFLKRNNYK